MYIVQCLLVECWERQNSTMWLPNFWKKKNSRREEREWHYQWERRSKFDTHNVTISAHFFFARDQKWRREKKKKKCQWCCRNKRGEREKEVYNCGNSVAKIGERKKMLIVAMVLAQLPTLFSISLISH